jgi:hypothetical protein
LDLEDNLAKSIGCRLIPNAHKTINTASDSNSDKDLECEHSMFYEYAGAFPQIQAEH